MEIKKDIAGIILSGGKSKRMGTDKGFCQLNKRSLISYAINTMKDVCHPVYISANSDDYKSFGYSIIKDEISDIGPLGGIYSALLKSVCEENIIISCDMPLVSIDLIHYILEHKGHYQVVLPIFNGYPEPLCAFYKREIVDFLYRSIQKKKYKIQDVVKGLDTKYLDIDSSLNFYNEDLFTNVNNLKELTRIELMMKAQEDES